MQLGRELRGGRGDDEGRHEAHHVRHARRAVTQEPQRVDGPFGGMHDGAAVQDRADLVQPVGEAGDHAKISAAAAQRPEQIGVLLLARADDPAVGGDDLGFQQTVARQAACALEPPETAAEREARDAGVRDLTAGDGEPVVLRRAVEFGPYDPGFGGGHPADGVDLDALHRRQVHHQAVVAHRQAGDAVAPAPHGDREPMVASETDGRDHVIGAGAADDHCGAAVDRPVPHLPDVVVAGRLGGEHGSGDLGAQLGERCGVDEGAGGPCHRVLLRSVRGGRRSPPRRVSGSGMTT